MSVSYGCIKLLDNIRFQEAGLEELMQSSIEQDLILLKREFPNYWIIISKEPAYQYEFYKNIESCEKLIENLLECGQEAYYSKLKNKCPDKDEIDRTNKIIKINKFKNW